MVQDNRPKLLRYWANIYVCCRRDCFCNYQFNVKACSVQGIYKTSDVVKNDPDSVACPVDTIELLSTALCFHLWSSNVFS